MLKRWTYILIAGVLMAALFWLLNWVHHALVTGLNPFLDLIFIILVTVTVLPLLIWGFRKLQWSPWMLFAAGALCWLIWGFVWRAFMGQSTLDIHVHDTYFVIAGFQSMLLFSFLFMGVAGIYFRLERGGHVNGIVGRIHFWVTFMGCWLLFRPQSYEGLAGMPRRYFDYSYGFLDFGATSARIAVITMVTVIAQLLFVGMIVYHVARKFFRRSNN